MHAGGQRAHGDRHPHERAEAALVVGDVDLPDPCRAALVADAPFGVDEPPAIGRRKLVWFDIPCAI